MSQPSRPQARGPESRRRRDLQLNAVQLLEDRCLLAPIVSVAPRIAVFSPSATAVAGTTSGGVQITEGQPDPTFLTDAPFTSVSQLTPISSFGGDIVRIRSGPGGDFGKGVYAISRGAGENAANSPANTTTTSTATGLSSTGFANTPTVSGAINRPGVIYRVDPATGKTSVFFDLNTVVSQIDPGTTAANSVGGVTGLVNWYDITFDPEGYFDGKPSMFVASVDRADPAKNAVYRIAPDGTFMGAFVQFTQGQSALKFNVNPSAILVPPVEDQSFLRGLIAGGGTSTTGGTFSALFFDANAFTPGANISTGTLPNGVQTTGLDLGPITGLTAANADYLSRVYSTFADFGTPSAAGIPSATGLSGVQGINGELLINNPAGTAATAAANTFSTSTDSTITDRLPTVSTDFRRFEDIAFDQYGYFAQGVNLNASTGTATTNGVGSVGGTGAGGGSGTGVGPIFGAPGSTGIQILGNTVSTLGLQPANAGNVFVADLGTGLSVPVAIPNTTPARSIRFPVQGTETISITNPANTDLSGATATVTVSQGTGLGGRIVRITPSGVVRNFAENFHTSNNVDSSGFELSSLSITFSADGTTLYAADDDGIWQFKTVASLAGSTSGSTVGLNDLRSLGVPYDGQNSAVAVIDTGVDAAVSSFRGRVAPGNNVITTGFGNVDTAPAGTVTTTGTTTTGNTGGNNGTAGTTKASPLSTDGHGTPVAGVIAQFVPQATIVPVNIFSPYLAGASFTSTTTGGGNGGGNRGGGNRGGGNNGGNGGGTASASPNAVTTSEFLYKGLDYVAKHPFANDPVRPGKVNRVVAATLGFGSTDTFDSEGAAFRKHPQIVIGLKNQFKKFRSLGIAPVAAAGQYGAPFGAGGNTGGNGNTNSTTGGGGTQIASSNNAQNANVGDNNGMSMPAILNEVTSVTGSYPFPFATGPDAGPNGPPPGVALTLGGPVIVFNTIQTFGQTSGTAGGTTGGGGTGATGGGTTITGAGVAGTLISAEAEPFADRIVGSSNRGITTDFAAPEIDIPTFRRRLQFSTTGTATTGLGGTGGLGGSGGTSGSGTGATGGSAVTATTAGAFDPANHNTFQDGGTSLSAGIVTGAFAMVSSALNYWATMEHTGATSDAYLTQPVGVKTLNFGPHAFKDMTAYNNPDGINSILQWTAVPASSPNDTLSLSTSKNLIGSTQFPSYSRVSVSNAIAAIEGEIAMQYLIDHNDLQYIDANKNGLVSAQELQDFVDNANAAGMPEAGAMARLLGGTARIGSTQAAPFGGATPYGETPDQPDVLQRRFNFFDYAAHGTLNGSISINEIQLLAHTLLPSPDAFVVNDRQRSSATNYLLAPTTMRNYHDLNHIKPTYQFVPQSAFIRYRNISPAKFHVDRNVPAGNSFPFYTLFNGPRATPNAVSNAATGGTASKAVTLSGNPTGTATGTPAATAATSAAPATAMTAAQDTGVQAASTQTTPAVSQATTASTAAGAVTTATTPATVPSLSATAPATGTAVGSATQGVTATGAVTYSGTNFQPYMGLTTTPAPASTTPVNATSAYIASVAAARASTTAAAATAASATTTATPAPTTTAATTTAPTTTAATTTTAAKAPAKKNLVQKLLGL